MSPPVNLPIGVFKPGMTPLHRIDPRAKILILAILLMAIVLTDTWSGLALIGAITAVGMISVGGVSSPLRDIRAFWLFYVFTILMHLIFDRDGETVFSIYTLTITQAGITAGIFFSLKIVFIAVISGLLSRTTHPADLSKGVENLLPSRGRVARLSGRPGIVVGIALRMLPAILAEAERIRTAQMARGMVLDRGGAIVRIKNLLPLIGPLLSATLRRSETIHSAMVGRGFVLDGDRMIYRPLTMRRLDRVILTGVLTISIGAALL